MKIEWDDFKSFDDAEKEAFAENIKNFHNNVLSCLYSHFGLITQPQEIKNVSIRKIKIIGSAYKKNEEIIIKTPNLKKFKYILAQEFNIINYIIVHETARYLHHLTNPDFWERNKVYGISPRLPRLSRPAHIYELVPQYAESLYWTQKGKDGSYETFLNRKKSPYSRSGLDLFRQNSNLLEKIALLDEFNPIYIPFLDNMNVIWDKQKIKAIEALRRNKGEIAA